MMMIRGLMLGTTFFMFGCAPSHNSTDVRNESEATSLGALTPENRINQSQMIEKEAEEVPVAKLRAEAEAQVASEDNNTGPSYSTAAYCQTISETAGGSYSIEKTCRDMEADALAKIQARSIPSRIDRYCNEIGETAGGSYNIYNTCVDMELDAASTL